MGYAASSIGDCVPCTDTNCKDCGGNSRNPNICT